jgi:hypothetical protein
MGRIRGARRVLESGVGSRFESALRLVKCVQGASHRSCRAQLFGEQAMRPLSLIAVFLSVLAGAGCGKTACEKVADGYYTYRGQAIACGVTVKPAFKIGDACSNYIERCSSADLTVVETYSTCVSAIQCDTSNPSDLTASEKTCREKVLPSGLSNTCAAALTGVCEDLASASDALVADVEPPPKSPLRRAPRSLLHVFRAWGAVLPTTGRRSRRTSVASRNWIRVSLAQRAP